MAGVGDLEGQVDGEQTGVAQPFADLGRGRAMEVDTGHAASKRATPCASSEPIVPASTSPVPAVASAGLAKGERATRPSGAAMTVRAPLSTTTWPNRLAA